MCSSGPPSLLPAICERTRELLSPHVAAGCFDFKLTFLLYQSQDDSKIYFGVTLRRRIHRGREITKRHLGGRLRAPLTPLPSNRDHTLTFLAFNTNNGSPAQYYAIPGPGSASPYIHVSILSMRVAISDASVRPTCGRPCVSE
jgi:hypothetical protein